MCIRDRVSKAEEFINLANHDSNGVMPYEAMHKKRPPRIIESLVDFTWFTQPQKGIQVIMESRVKVKAEERARRQYKKRYKQVNYQIGELVLVRNRQLPSSKKKLMRKLFLCYVGPYIIDTVNNNNTVVIKYQDGKVKGTYNINQLRPYK